MFIGAYGVYYGFRCCFEVSESNYTVLVSLKYIPIFICLYTLASPFLLADWYKARKDIFMPTIIVFLIYGPKLAREYWQYQTRGRRGLD
jgi:hypothetical protein